MKTDGPRAALGLIVMLCALVLLGHYGWQLPVGIFLLWMAYNIDQALKGK